MYDYDERQLQPLVGKTITKIQFNEEYLIFTTNDGTFSYGVEGDCCSSSYFHDFIGVEKLLKGNPAVSVKSIPLTLPEEEKTEGDWNSEVIECYGFEIVTEDPTFGEVTAVFSFRNASNGYYGGNLVTKESKPSGVPVIEKDTNLG